MSSSCKKKSLMSQAAAISAFTLAETLITLSIVGVVAAMTMPVLINKINNQRYQTASKKVHSVMTQALQKMNVDETLGGYDNTGAFLDKFKEYVRIVQTCKSGSLTNCYPSKFLVDGEEFELSSITSSSSLGKDWSPAGDVEGIILNDGTSMLVSYNPSCENSTNFSAVNGCVAAVYDLNSIKMTNKYLGNGSSDLGTFNATFKKGLNCGEFYYNGEYSYSMNGPDGGNEECLESNKDKFAREFGCNEYEPIPYYSTLLNTWVISCSCLAKGTLITLKDGSTKKIEDVTFDDELLVWNFDEGKFDYSKPLWIMQPRVTTQYNLLTFSDGTVLRTINQHRIFNKEKGKFTYPMTDETPIGTTTLLADGREVQLIDKRVVSEPVEFYNLITEYHFNCFANGICTSNRFNNLYPIKDYKFVKDNRQMISHDNYKDIPYDWYSKLRLAEISDEIVQTDVNEYVQRLISTNQKYMSLV